MTASRLLERIGQMFDKRFQLLAVLGETTTSTTYLALDSKIDRRVVVRVLHEDLATDHDSVTVFRQRMQRESSLVYDNILPVYVSGEVPSTISENAPVPYFVTEFLGGGNLRTMLDAHGRLSLSQTVRIGIHVAKALTKAHQKATLHLDIRPENILFADDADQSLRVKDFGLARALAESSMTEPIAAGPSAQVYSAPEVLAGGEVDGRSDVYSLGLVLAECLTGTVPLTGSTTADTYRLRTTEDFVPSIDFGPLQEILRSACTTERVDRTDAATLMRALDDLAGSLETPEPLPIVPTLGSGSQTLELDRALITTTARTHSESLEPGELPGTVGEPNGVGATRSVQEATEPAAGLVAEPASDPEARFAVVVDEEEVTSMLAAGRPSSLGPVEPFGSVAVGNVAETGVDSHDAETRRRRRWPWIVLALFLVVAASAGGVAYWWYQIRIPTHLLPDVTGGQMDQARQSLEGLGFVVDIAGEEHVDGTVVDQVLAQDPGPETELGEGSTVHLTISLGPTLRTLPVVAGLTRDEAVTAITAADLVVGAETPAHDEEVPPGVVMSAQVAADGPAVDSDGKVPRDTTIDLVVSDGPAPREVPANLIGSSAEDARAALEALQLTANILEEYDETVPVGVIISSSAAPGELLERGAKVTLKMSKGPAPITVPNVFGMSGSAAASKLEAEGFTVRGIEGSPSGSVLQTDPPSGEKHPRGTSVRIFTRNS